MTLDASLAFLLPILAFVGFLGVFGWLLKDVAPPCQTALAVALALPVTIGLMLAVHFWLQRYRKRQYPE